MGGGQHVAWIQHPTDKTWYEFCDHHPVSSEAVNLPKLCKNNKDAIIIVYERDACPSLTWICARIVSKIYSSTSLPSTLPDDLVQFIKRVKHYWIHNWYLLKNTFVFFGWSSFWDSEDGKMPQAMRICLDRTQGGSGYRPNFPLFSYMVVQSLMRWKEYPNAQDTTSSKASWRFIPALALTSKKSLWVSEILSTCNYLLSPAASACPVSVVDTNNRDVWENHMWDFLVLLLDKPLKGGRSGFVISDDKGWFYKIWQLLCQGKNICVFLRCASLKY